MKQSIEQVQSEWRRRIEATARSIECEIYVEHLESENAIVANVVLPNNEAWTYMLRLGDLRDPSDYPTPPPMHLEELAKRKQSLK